MRIRSLVSRKAKTISAVMLAGTMAMGAVATMAGEAHADTGDITNLHVSSTGLVMWDPSPGVYAYEVREFSEKGTTSQILTGHEFQDPYFGVGWMAHQFEVYAVDFPSFSQVGSEAWTSEPVQNVSFKGGTLTWSPVVGPVGSAITYRIYRNGKFVTSTQGVHLYQTLYYAPSSKSSGDTFAVTVDDPAGTGNSISAPSSTLYLTAPTGIKLYNECNRGYELDWNPVPGASSYNVYGDGVLLAKGIWDTRYGFGTASAQSYQVTAVTGSVESAPSAALQAQTSKAILESCD